MARGGRGRGAVVDAAAVPRHNRHLVPANTDVPEGSGGRGGSSRARRGRGGRAPCGRGGAAASLPCGHMGVVAHEFLVGLHSPPRSKLRLLESFAEVISPNPPRGLWLQMDGCINKPYWVHIRSN